MSDQEYDPFAPREDEDAREERAGEIARHFGTTPNGLSGVTEAARRAAVTGTPDANATPWVPLGPRNVGGAIRCVAFRQPTASELAQKLPLHLAAGSAQGGLWISRTSGYRWEQAGLPDIVGAVGAVAWSAADRRVLYVGTGDLPLPYPGGIGFFRSEDGGASFTRLVTDSGGNGAAAHYLKIAIDPNDARRAWIASDTGLWRLDGNSFSAEAITGVAAGSTVTDVALAADPANNNQYFLLVGIQGIGTAVGTWDRRNRRMTGWQVTTAGAVGTPWPAAVGIVRVAWGLTNPVPTAHAILQDMTPVGAPPAAVNRPTPLFTSANLGVGWASVAGANSPEPGTRIAWYALSLAVNPLNPAMVIAGSTDLFRTTDGGATPWTRIMDWTRYDNGDHAQHADHHATVFEPGSTRVWVCNDGGMSTTDNIGAAAPVWRKRSYGVVAAQLFDITSHRTFPGLCGGGMQDNGTFVSYGGPSWYSVDGGDGGAMGWHPTSPYRMYSSWQGSADRVDVSTFSVAAFHIIPLVDIAPPNNQFAPYHETQAIQAPSNFFVRALATHPTTPDLVLYGSSGVLQFTSDGFNIATANTGIPAASNVTTVAFSPDGNHVWGGTDAGEVVHLAGALPSSVGGGVVGPAWNRVLPNAAFPIAGFPITAIAAHPANANVVVVTTALNGAGNARVLLTHDAGANWHRIDSGLPASPYLSAAWDPASQTTLFVGTAAGAYVARDLPAVGTLAPGAAVNPTWRTFNQGLPLVPITDLETHPVTQTLRCATLGRGAFEVSLAGVTPAAFQFPSVRLVIRNHAGDDGRPYVAANTLGADPRVGIAARPPVGAPAPAAPATPAGPVDVTHAIDIRIDSPRFQRSEAWNFGEQIDGAEFDEVLVPDRALVGDQNIVYVQVQNRGTSAANNVDVHLYYADAGNPIAVPAIDAAFNFPGTPGAGSPWTKADMITEGDLRPGEPHVVAFRVIPKLEITTNIAFLAIATSGQDALANVPAGAVDAFVRGERRAALHVAGVDRDTILIRDVTSDRGERGGVAWGGRSPDIIVRQAQVPAANLAAEFADLTDAHAGDVAHGGNNFVYVRVTNRTQQVIPRSVVRLFLVSRTALGIPGPDGANWREMLPTATLTNIAAGGWAVAEFPMNFAAGPANDPDPDNAVGQKGIILVAMANVTDAAGTTVLDPFPDFADITGIDGFWRFFNGGALGNNAAMRALPFTP